MRTKVLIADDDIVSRRILTMILTRLNCQVTEAANGAQAWKAFKRDPVSIVISDWVMPWVDGLTLHRKIRGSPHSDCVFFFLLTGRKNGSKSYYQAKRAGVDDFLYKPIDSHVISHQLNAARRALTLRQGNDEPGARWASRRKRDGVEDKKGRLLV